MRGRRHVVAAVAAVALALAILPTPVWSVYAAQSPATVATWTVSHIPWTASPTGPVGRHLPPSTRHGALTVTGVSLTGHVLTVSGYTAGSGPRAIFSLVGPLSRGVGGHNVYATLTDSTGNFVAWRFDVDLAPTAAPSLFLSPPAAVGGRPYLALYLEKSNTRNVVFTEAPAAALLGSDVVQRLKRLVPTLPIAPASASAWLATAFRPNSFHDSALPGVEREKRFYPALNGRYPLHDPAYRVYTRDVVLSAHYYFAGSLTQDRMDVSESTNTPRRGGFAAVMPVSLAITGTAWIIRTARGGTETLIRDRGSRWMLGFGGAGDYSNVGVTLAMAPELGIASVASAVRWERQGRRVAARLGPSPLDQGTFPPSESTWGVAGDSTAYLHRVGDYVRVTFQVINPTGTRARRIWMRASWFFDPYYAWGSGYRLRPHTDALEWVLNPKGLPDSP